FFFSSRRRHTSCLSDWSSDVCSSDLRYATLGLPAAPFGSVGFFAPPKPGVASATPHVSARTEGVTSFFWTIEEFCRDELLRFLFADAEDDRPQYTMVIQNVAARSKEALPTGDAAVQLEC